MANSIYKTAVTRLKKKKQVSDAAKKKKEKKLKSAPAPRKNELYARKKNY